MKARVVKSTGSWYFLKEKTGQIHKARLRGKFRIDGIQHTNPVAVGDWVEFEIDNEGLAVITGIQPRTNYIIRRSVNLSKRTHIIASNIDKAFLIVTLDNPKTSTGFIDRFLITAEAYHIPVVLVINKMDTYDNELLKAAKTLKEIYENIGYRVLEISAVTGFHLEELKSELKAITSLFSGHSGVGKSTLMNVLHPELEIKTAEISDFNQKGQHTTTFAEMHEWPFGGHCIDTPGIKEFGLTEMEKEEIQGYFPEIFARKENCKFYNCLHTIEPGCAIKIAVENHEIADSRYRNYLNFMEETDVK
ncbi:MAG: ribosome small subunit-dependent GTPase A [Weeksellaceae bacterium]